MGLADSTPNFMQRLPRFPTTPYLDSLHCRESGAPLPFGHKHHL
jgi:hypothetical protein